MTLGERIRPADVAISFERRGCLRRQARYLVQIPPPKSTPKTATSALGVRRCRSWPKTRSYLDERMFGRLVHPISVLVSQEGCPHQRRNFVLSSCSQFLCHQ